MMIRARSNPSVVIPGLVPGIHGAAGLLAARSCTSATVITRGSLDPGDKHRDDNGGVRRDG
jgi:hypothetical protein